MNRGSIIKFVTTKLFRRKFWAILTLGGFAVCFTATAILNYAAVDVTRERVFIDSQDESVECLIVDPVASPYDKKPFLILVHGFMCSSEYMQSFSIEFAKRGFLTVSISMPGHGMSTGPSYGTLKSPYAAIDAIDYILTHNDKYNVDESRIGLIGHSMGAMTVTKAGFMDDRINATVAIAAPSWNATSDAPLSQLLNTVDEDSIADVLGFWFDVTPLTSYIDLKLPKNYFFVVGDMDELVYEEDARAMLSAGTGIATKDLVEGQLYVTSEGGRRKFQTYSWIEHNMESFDARVIRDVINWVESSLSVSNTNAITLTEQFRFPLLMLGFVLGLLSIFPTISYLRSGLLPDRRDLEGYSVRVTLSESESNSNTGQENLSRTRPLYQDVLITLGAYVIIGGLVGGMLTFLKAAKPYLSMLGYIAFPTMFGTAIILIPVIYLLARTVWKPLPLDQGRWFQKETTPTEVVFGLLAAGFAMLMVNLGFTPFWINMAPLGPRFLPLFVGMAVALPIAFTDTVIFKGYLLNRFQAKGWGFLKGGIPEWILFSIVKGGTFGLAFVLFLPENPFPSFGVAFVFVGGVAILLVGGLDLLSRWVFFQTRSVLATATFTTVVYAFVFTQMFPMV